MVVSGYELIPGDVRRGREDDPSQWRAIRRADIDALDRARNEFEVGIIAMDGSERVALRLSRLEFRTTVRWCRD